MLTRDLLRTRSVGDYIKPSFIDTGDPRLLSLASSLLAIFENGTGSTQAEISEMCSVYVNTHKDLKLAKGILKIITDRAKFSSFAELDYPTMRREIFLHVATLLRSEKLPSDPGMVHDAVFNSLPEELQTMYPGIYIDLPENEKLISIKKTFAKELLERYNVSLVQSLILYASKLEIDFTESDQGKLRRLLKYLRFFRLLLSAELKKAKDGTRIKMTVDGPSSIFENSTKYGLQLASFFPAVCQMEKWKISCEIKLRDKVKKLSLDSGSGLQSHYANFSAYTPEEIRIFAAYFQKESKKWQIDLTPGFMRIEAQKLIFPDFIFRNKENTSEYPMELFHRWHSTQFEERLSFCENNKDLNLLLGVDRSLLKKDGLLKSRLEASEYFNKHGFLFRDFPGVENVRKLLNSL